MGIYSWLGAPDESNNSVLEVDVFGCGIRENVNMGGGRGTSESQLNKQNSETGEWILDCNNLQGIKKNIQNVFPNQ